MTENEVRKIFAENLKRLRKQRGLSQLKLANELQMAMTFINDIENCKKWISPETLSRFATFFCCSVSDFFLSTPKEDASLISTEAFAKVLSAELNDTILRVNRQYGIGENI